MLAGAGLRWHHEVLGRPVVLREFAGRLVVVQQEGDCVATGVRASSLVALAQEAGVPVVRIVVPKASGGWSRGAGVRIPSVTIARGMRRAGVRMTPAVLVVDDRGVVRLVQSMQAVGGEETAEDMVKLLGALLVHLSAGDQGRRGVSKTSF